MELKCVNCSEPHKSTSSNCLVKIRNDIKEENELEKILGKKLEKEKKKATTMEGKMMQAFEDAFKDEKRRILRKTKERTVSIISKAKLDYLELFARKLKDKYGLNKNLLERLKPTNHIKSVISEENINNNLRLKDCISNDKDNNEINSSSKLRIGSLNARSLVKNKDDIIQFIAENNLDILCVQETWLSPNTRPINICGYKIIGTEPTTRRGCGLSIILKNNLQFKIKVIQI
jgi:hypothetical protein